MIEPLEMFEIKQGPYAGENDKTRFAEASASEIRVKGPAL
ncbi:mannose-6-phosphate isomerase-like protein (cupin superfamily) [Bradyrhizobium sp. USDA 328]